MRINRLGVLVSLAFAAAAPPPERRVTIPADGWQLAGTFRSPEGSGPFPAVLLLHGAARDRRAYVPLAQELAARGVASLRLDLRGEGESTTLGRFEPGVNGPFAGADRDAAAALAWLRQQASIDGRRIGALGASYSGEALARASRDGAPAAAYVALSPGDFSEQSAREIDGQGRPWWFIASRQERFAHTVVSGIPAHSRTARVTLVDGTSHASDILSPHFTLNAEIADWFAARLTGLTAPPAWGGLDTGPHAVGFRREHAATPRGTLTIDLWYPARPSSAPPMRVEDYLRLADDLRGAAGGFPTGPTAIGATLATAITGEPAGLSPAQIEAVLGTPHAARRDAPGAGGRFPLVLWTPRYATTVAQATMSEYLASLGFAVAFVRSSSPSRLPFELTTPESKLAELEARVDDMRAAVAWAAARSEVDVTRIGVVAWSYTGEMATRLQQAEPRVALVAGLSTTLVNDWVFQPPDALSRLDLSRSAAAYASIGEVRGAPKPMPAALAAAPAGYFVELPGLAHGSFNALEGHLPSLLKITRVQRFSTSSPQAARGYETAAILVGRLLRHHVADGSVRPLSPLALTTGLPRDLLTATGR